MIIPYENLERLNNFFAAELVDSASKVIKSGWYILGENLRIFEESFAAYNNSNHCIGVASGLDALILSLAVFDFDPGDEVIVPANTYIATILAILHNNLKPVLVEPDIATYNINPEKIEQFITAKTRAVMVVHLYGKPCPMDDVLRIAEKHGLKIIEDCAQSHGAEYNGKKTGNFGHCNAFSFYPTKNLGALGDAGAIVTNDEKIAEKLRKLRNYGSKIKYHNEIAGYNSRLDEIQAGFLQVKLKYLDKINDHKRKLAQIYDAELGNSVIRPVRSANAKDVFHIYPIRIEKRDKLREYLSNAGIGTEIHYPIPPHRQQALQHMRHKKICDFSDTDFPLSDEIHATILSLPISFFHSEKEISTVAAAIKSF